MVERAAVDQIIRRLSRVLKMKAKQPSPRGSRFESGGGDFLFQGEDLLEKILRTAILTAGLGLSLIGCRTAEPEKQLFDVLGSQVVLAPDRIRTQEEILAEQNAKIAQIKTIIAENKVEHIDDVFLYTKEKGKELFEALEKRYGPVDKGLAAAFDRLQNYESLLVILPVESIGQQKGSYLCFFKKMAEEIRTEGDLTSMVVDYAGTIAEINAEGMMLNNKPVRELEIRRAIGPMLYRAIVELRARIKQINNSERLSENYKKFILGGYASALSIINYHNPEKNPYAKQALEDAKKEMTK